MENIVLVSDADGHIICRYPNGTWVDVTPAGGMPYPDTAIYSLWGVNNKEVYAVGGSIIGDGYPVYYKWDGISFTPWSNPPPVITAFRPNGWHPVHIFGLSSDLIWVTAINYWSSQSYIYQWDGVSWTTIYDGVWRRYATWAPDSDNLFTVGSTIYNYPSLFKYNGGTSWLSDLSVNQYPIYGIWGSEGVLFCHETADYAWRGTFGGGMVRSPYLGDITFKYGRAFMASSIWSYGGKCWIPNVSYGGVEDVRVAIYDGSSWSMQILDAIPHGHGAAVTGTSDTNVIIIRGSGSSDDTDAYLWNGATWEKEDVPFSGFGPTCAWGAPGPFIEPSDVQSILVGVPDVAIIRAQLTTTSRHYLAESFFGNAFLKPTRFILSKGSPVSFPSFMSSSDSTGVLSPLFTGTLADGSLFVDHVSPTSFALRLVVPLNLVSTATELFVYANLISSSTGEVLKTNIPFAFATFPNWYFSGSSKFKICRVVISM